MAADGVDRYFNGTCVPTKYRCVVDTKYIDPCTCESYFQCANEFSIIPRPCSDGTGFNHETGTCTGLQEIIVDGLCDPYEPWTRCPDSDGYDESALQKRCTGVGPSTTPAPEDSDGVDGGLIAGVIIAVLVVIVLAVLLVVYIRKKGNPIQHLRNLSHKGGRHGAGQPSSSQTGARHGDEETYAEIDDTALYKDPSGGKKVGHSLSHTNEAYEADVEEGVAYDNPALRRDTPLPPEPSPLQVPPDYSALDTKEQFARSYSSLNEHHGAAATGDTSSKELVTGDDGYLVAEAIGDSQRNSGPTDPSYFVLEKS